MKKITLILAILFVISLAGCYGMSEQEKFETQFYATAYARDGVVPPPKYQTLAAEQLNFRFDIATPTPTPNPHWTPTLSAMEWSSTQAAQVQNNAMTAQVQQQQFEMDKLLAEQAAQNSENTAIAARSTAEAYSMQQTAEARALAVQYTAQAEGTKVMNTAIANATNTAYIQQVNNQSTAVAAASTNAVLPTHAVWTQQAVYAIQTIEQGEANKVELAVRRQKMKNGFDALGPWLGFIGITIVVAYGFGIFVKTRVHARDEHGRVPLLQMRTNSGDTIIVKPEMMESSTMKIGRDGAVVRYAPMDAEEQSDINRRNQAIEAIAALPTPYAQTGAKIVTSEFNSTRARVTVGNPHAMSSVLDEADQGFLEEAKNE